MKQDGGRLYNCGVFLNKVQCEVLDAIVDDREYCNALVTAVFGSETLKKSSVKGSISNRTKAPAKDRLDPKDLKFVYGNTFCQTNYLFHTDVLNILDIMAIRTRNSVDFTSTNINKIINKKISNLLAPKRGPKPLKKNQNDATAAEDDENIEIDTEENYEESQIEAEVSDVGNVEDIEIHTEANYEEVLESQIEAEVNDVGNVEDTCSQFEQFDLGMIGEHDAQWTYDENSYYLINVPNANDFSALNE